MHRARTPDPETLLTAPNSVAELVEVVADLVGSPVTVEDHDFRLLAYSRQAGPVDRARRDTIFNKAVPSEIARWLRRSGVMQRIYRNHLPVRVPSCPRLGLSRRTAIAVRAGDRILGHIWVMERRRRSTRAVARILPRAATIAAALLLRQEAERAVQSRLIDEFLMDLLDGRVVNEVAARRRAEALQMDLPVPFAVLVIDIDAFETHIAGRSESWVQALKTNLLATIRATAARAGERPLALWRGDSVVMVLGGAASVEGAPSLAERVRTLADALHAQLPRRFSNVSFSIGASRVLRELEHLPHAYAQAIDAARIGGAFLGRRLPVHYDDLGIYRLLHAVRDEILTNGHASTHLERLQAYDGSHKTSLVDTLEAYLDAFGNVHEVARKLHVHSNTVRYRVRQIREVAALDLRDPGLRLVIHLELKLRRVSVSARQHPPRH